MASFGTNFPALSAPLSILLLLGTVALVLLCLAGAAISALSGGRTNARRLALSASGLAASYAAALCATAFASRDRTVHEKAFCEIDCHIAYTAASARLEDPAPGRRLATIRLVARFDERTISPSRGDAPLTPNAREVFLVDGAGVRYAPVLPSSVLSRALRPGESSAADFAFEIPPGTAGLRLLVTESDWPTYLLIGHENAPLSGKVYLALPG